MGRDDPEMSILFAIADSCQAFNCLPTPGGLFDQDPYLIEGMKAALVGRAKHEERMRERAHKMKDK